MIRTGIAVHLAAWIALGAVVVALVLVGRLPVDVAATVGVIAAVGVALGLLARVVLGSSGGRSRFAPSDSRVESLSKLLAVGGGACLVAGVAGVQIAGVNVVVGIFPALAAIALLHAGDAIRDRGRRLEATGGALFGIGWLALGLTAVGVPEVLGMLLVLLGGGISLWPGIRSNRGTTAERSDGA